MKKSSSQLQKKMESTWKRVQPVADDSWKHFNRYTVKRWRNWRQAKTFMWLWVGLITVICSGLVWQVISLRSVYMQPSPAPGGTWRDGMVGSIGNLNPLFASTGVDSAVGHLVFNGLLKYDHGNNLVTDLAQSMDISSDGKTRTIHLRKNVKWHDGEDFTASDVVYTIKTIQDPATGTPLNSGWRDVKVTSPDQYTVVLTLPAPFAPFDAYLTNAILPEHILSKTPNSQLRTALYNTSPVGTGPFIFRNSNTFPDRQAINFYRNDKYFLSPAKLQSFSVIGYQDERAVAEGLESRYLTAAVLNKSVDQQKLDLSGVRHSQVPLDKIAFVFFNISKPSVRDRTLRQALSYATDQAELVKQAGTNGIPAKSPLIPGQLGYNSGHLVQTNIAKAKQILSQDGYRAGRDGVLVKGKKRLSLKLTTSKEPTYLAVANELERQWRKVGVEIKIESMDGSQFQQSVLLPHNYEMLLYSVSIGSDPDEYVYWHSSQAASGGLNLSEYKSNFVDSLLDGGRTRLDPDLRAQKYQAFMKQFAVDAPAVPLYQLTYNYYINQPAQGVNITTQPDMGNRYDNVTQWSQRLQLLNQTP